MDLSPLCTDDQTRSPASLTESQTGGLDSLSLLCTPTEKMLSAYETGAEAVAVADLSDPTDKSTETLSNISKCLSQEKHTDLSCLKLPSSTYNTSECLSLCSEPVPKENNLRVHPYFSSSEPILPHLPHLSHELISPPSETFTEPPLSLSLTEDNTAPEPFGAMSCISGSSYLLRPLSPHSDSSEGDTATAPESDLYIFESETQDFILNRNVDPCEIKCPEHQPLSQKEENKTHYDCDSHILMCDSADVLTKCHHSSTDERAMVDYDESDMGQYTGLRPPAVDACVASLMAVNDDSQEKAEVTGIIPQARQSDSPAELWLDAYQYLTGEDTPEQGVLDNTHFSVMQGVTSDVSLVPGETPVSGYSHEGSEGIGWIGEDTISWGPPVERWSSVDSWASALSDWAAIIAAPPEDITAAFTEIGAEIDALTQALAEVNTDTDRETSKEGQSQKSAAPAQPQPPMGVQDQPLVAHNIPESSVLSGQSCLALCLESSGPEPQDQSTDSAPTIQEEIQSSQREPFSCPIHPHSPMGTYSATVASPGGYSVDVTAATLIPGSTSSADLDLSEFGGYAESLENDIFSCNEDPVILNIIEETDLEEQHAPAELIIGQPSGDELREVTDDTAQHIISQPGFVAQQEAKGSCRPAGVDGERAESSADPNFLSTHSLTTSHVPGVNTQPDLHVNVLTHVSPSTLPEVDGERQVEPQWGSPKFIMPLAPLSPLACWTSSSLEGDQICAKRSLNDNRDLCCDHVQPGFLWPTSDRITDKPSLKDEEEPIHKKENAIDSAEKTSPDGQLDLHTDKTSECFLTERKTKVEDIHELSRELSNLAVVPADHFIISETNRVAVITLDLYDPFVSKAAKPITTPELSERAELNQKTAEKMPHKTHKTSEGKTRSKKDKSAGHHHGTQASKRQENLTNHVSNQQTCKQPEIHSLAGENQTSENTPVGFEENQAKLGIDSGVAPEKPPNKPHGKKKKKHGQHATAQKSGVEPLAEVENGAKPKTARGRIDMFEAKLGAKAEKAQKDSDQSGGSERKSQQPEAKASRGERPAHHTEHKDHPSKNLTSPLKDDVTKKRRLSEDKFGKIISVLESKLPKADVSIKAKAEEPKTDAETTRKKAYSEVVKQTVPPRADPKVVQPIQAVSVSGDPQSLCLWCQFAAVFSDYTVTWSRDGAVLSEIKRSAGDESRVSVTISNASHKDLGKYQCRLNSSHGSVTLDYLLTYEVLSEIVIPLSPKTSSSAPVEVGSEEEDVHCSRLMFREDFLSDQYFGENHPVSIVTEKVHFGEGMHRRAFRTKLQSGQMPLLVPGHSCVLKVHNAISYGTKNNEELVQKNYTLAVEECQVQNTAREYIRVYTAAAQSTEAFGDVPEIIPIYLVHRPSNDIPYATLEEELIGDFVKYSVKDGKEINLLRRDSEAGQKCCAFQHWVYHNTEGNLLVTDMQGVGMRLTDVGIATCKKGYKGFKGNCATSFIDQFKALHQCNSYCEILGLKSLQPKARKPTSAPKPKPQTSAAPKKKTFGPTLKGKS